ncbi:MAG: sulfotransferase, partial [Aestuariivirga sp.]
PADTFISTYQNNFTKDFGFAFEQRAFAHYFLQKEKLMAYWRTVMGTQILDVKYEELVANPESVVRGMLAFLDLEWDPACLKFFERQSSVRTFSKDQVRREINTQSIARWKNYEKHLSPLFESLSAAGFEYGE